MCLLLLIGIAFGQDGRVYDGEDAFFLETGFEIPSEVLQTRGALTWRYSGPARYAAGERFGDGRDSGPARWDEGYGSDDLGMFADTVREDSSGREWRVTHVDWDAIDDAVEAYGGDVLADFGPEERLGPYERDAIDLEGDDRVDALFSWDAYEDDKWSIWDNDSRYLQGAQDTVQRKALLYMAGDATTGPIATCTATMIDNHNGGQFASTAGHCVKSGNGSWISPRGWVCVDGNSGGGAQCAKVVARYTNGWSGSSSPGSADYALLELDNNVNLGVGYMALSQASNSTIKAAPAWNLAYPYYLPAILPSTTPATVTQSVSFGNGANCNPNASSTTLEADCSIDGYESSGTVRYTSSSRIGTTLDLADGHSGGPIYYFSSGGGHFMTGLATSSFLVVGTRHNGGPKIPGALRTWYISSMDSYR